MESQTTSTEELTDFVLDVKPYHTKISEVIDVYSFFDDLNVVVVDSTFKRIKLAGVWGTSFHATPLSSSFVLPTFLSRVHRRGEATLSGVGDVDWFALTGKKFFFTRNRVGLRSVTVDGVGQLESHDFYHVHSARTSFVDSGRITTLDVDANSKPADARYPRTITMDDVGAIVAPIDSDGIGKYVVTCTDVDPPSFSMSRTTVNPDWTTTDDGVLLTDVLLGETCRVGDALITPVSPTSELFRSVDGGWSVGDHVDVDASQIESWGSGVKVVVRARTGSIVDGRTISVSRVLREEIQVGSSRFFVDVGTGSAAIGDWKLVAVLASGRTEFDVLHDGIVVGRCSTERPFSSLLNPTTADRLVTITVLHVEPGTLAPPEGTVIDLMLDDMVSNVKWSIVDTTAPPIELVGFGSVDLGDLIVSIVSTPEWDPLNSTRSFSLDLKKRFLAIPFQAESSRVKGRATMVDCSTVEEWTLTCVHAPVVGTNPTAFNVVGSSSGDVGVALCGQPFVHSAVSFTIEQIGTFSRGDVFTFTPRLDITVEPSFIGRKTILDVNPRGFTRPSFFGPSFATMTVDWLSNTTPAQRWTLTYNAGNFVPHGSASGAADPIVPGFKSGAMITVGGVDHMRVSTIAPTRDPTFALSDGDQFVFDVKNDVGIHVVLDFISGYDLWPYGDPYYDARIIDYPLDRLRFKVLQQEVPDGTVVELKALNATTFEVWEWEPGQYGSDVPVPPRSLGTVSLDEPYNDGTYSFTVVGVEVAFIPNDTILGVVVNPPAQVDGTIGFNCQKAAFVHIYAESFARRTEDLPGRWIFTASTTDRVRFSPSFIGDGTPTLLGSPVGEGETFDNGHVHFTINEAVDDFIDGDGFFFDVLERKIDTLIVNEDGSVGKAVTGEWYWDGDIGFKRRPSAQYVSIESRVPSTEPEDERFARVVDLGRFGTVRGTIPGTDVQFELSAPGDCWPTARREHYVFTWSADYQRFRVENTLGQTNGMPIGVDWTDFQRRAQFTNETTSSGRPDSLEVSDGPVKLRFDVLSGTVDIPDGFSFKMEVRPDPRFVGTYGADSVVFDVDPPDESTLKLTWCADDDLRLAIEPLQSPYVDSKNTHDGAVGIHVNRVEHFTERGVLDERVSLAVDPGVTVATVVPGGCGREQRITFSDEFRAGYLNNPTSYWEGVRCDLTIEQGGSWNEHIRVLMTERLSMNGTLALSDSINMSIVDQSSVTSGTYAWLRYGDAVSVNVVDGPFEGFSSPGGYDMLPYDAEFASLEATWDGDLTSTGDYDGREKYSLGGVGFLSEHEYGGEENVVATGVCDSFTVTTNVTPFTLDSSTLDARPLEESGGSMVSSSMVGPQVPNLTPGHPLTGTEYGDVPVCYTTVSSVTIVVAVNLLHGLPNVSAVAAFTSQDLSVPVFIEWSVVNVGEVSVSVLTPGPTMFIVVR